MLALDTLLDDLHMEETEETAAESEIECFGSLWLVDQSRIVQLQFFKRILEIAIILPFSGIDTGIDHGFCLAVAGKRLIRWTGCEGDGIAYTALGDGFETGGDIANIPGFEHGNGLHHG